MLRFYRLKTTPDSSALAAGCTTTLKYSEIFLTALKFNYVYQLVFLGNARQSKSLSRNAQVLQDSLGSILETVPHSMSEYQCTKYTSWVSCVSTESVPTALFEAILSVFNFQICNIFMCYKAEILKQPLCIHCCSESPTLS